MAGPFLLLVLWRDWRLPRFWISALAGGVLIGLVGLATVQCYGGWEAYQRASSALHQINAPSGILTGGGWKTGGLNMLRAGWWLLLAVPLLPLLLPASRLRRRDCSLWSMQVLLPLALAFGVLVVVFGYLCVHPGYLAPALPALFVLLAHTLRPGRALAGACAVQSVLGLVLFFLPGPFRPPASAGEAAANALFLQFTARAHREAIPTMSLSAWLLEAGRDDLVPPRRLPQAGTELPQVPGPGS